MPNQPSRRDTLLNILVIGGGLALMPLAILFGAANVGAGWACWQGIRAQEIAVAIQTQTQLDRSGRRDLLPAVAGLQGHWLVRYRH